MTPPPLTKPRVELRAAWRSKLQISLIEGYNIWLVFEHWFVLIKCQGTDGFGVDFDDKVPYWDALPHLDVLVELALLTEEQAQEWKIINVRERDEQTRGHIAREEWLQYERLRKKFEP